MIPSPEETVPALDPIDRGGLPKLSPWNVASAPGCEAAESAPGRLFAGTRGGFSCLGPAGIIIVLLDDHLSQFVTTRIHTKKGART